MFQGDVSVKFDRLQAGSLPPKFTRIHTDTTDKDTLVSNKQMHPIKICNACKIRIDFML